MKMSTMTIDARAVLNIATIKKIEAAETAMDAGCGGGDAPDRNSVARYRRLIRRCSGCAYVTCHSVEHDAMYNPASKTVAFGRWIS
jgi:hypothetical protein